MNEREASAVLYPTSGRGVAASIRNPRAVVAAGGQTATYKEAAMGGLYDNETTIARLEVGDRVVRDVEPIGKLGTVTGTREDWEFPFVVTWDDRTEEWCNGNEIARLMLDLAEGQGRR